MSDGRASFALHPRTIVSILRYTLVLGALALFFYAIPRIYHLVSMTLVALLISYLLNPPVNLLERRGLTRGAATTIVFIVLGILVGYGLFLSLPILWDQSLELRSFLSQHQPTDLIETYLRQLETRLGFIPRGRLVGQVDAAYSWILQQLTGLLQNFYIAGQYFILVPFISFFLIRDRRRIRRFVVQSVPNPFFEVAFNIYYKIDQKLGDYIRGIIIESLIIAVLSIVGLWIIDLPYLFVIGIFAGCSNVVPYFGPVAGAVPALVVQYFQVSDPLYLLPVLIVFLVVQLLDNVFVKPLVVARTMDLHPLLVLLVVVAGGQLYGILGMIMSIPIASMFIVVVSEINWAVQNYSFTV